MSRTAASAGTRDARARSARVADPLEIAPQHTCIEIATGDGVVRPLKTSERVARAIVSDVLEQRLRSGDSLPSEAEMLVHYGVSRESLREGLRLLEVQGLISIRRGPGGGPSVGLVDPANLGRTAALHFHMAGGVYEELFEAWVFAEGEIAERAAKNMDPDLRAEVMAKYSVPFDSRTHDTVEEFVKDHVRFHGAVASLIGNRVLEISLQTYGQIVSHHVMFIDDTRTIAHQLADEHHAIALAIGEGQAALARDLMESHIRNVMAHTDLGKPERVSDLIDWQ